MYRHGERIVPTFIDRGAPLRNWACQNPPFLRSKRRRALRRSSLFEPMMRISFASTSTRSRERAQVVAAVAAGLGPHPPAGLPGESLEGLRCDDGGAAALDRILGPLCVDAGLVADGLELGNAVREHRIGEIGDAVPDRVAKSLELDSSPICSRSAVRASTAGTLSPL